MAAPQVFISYAREDQAQAVRLSKDIEKLGAQTWIDITQMIPGLDFKTQIEDALDVCDYVILLLSHNSIEKNGFIQVEKRYILDRLEYRPPGQIFLIPTRLEECKPRHKQIKNLHWVDLFPSWNKGLKNIARALNIPEKGIDFAEFEKKPAKVKPGILSVKDYFEVVLPTMLRWKGKEATSLKKKVRFVITGKSGGIWTIDFSPPVAKVIAKEQGKADLGIKITSQCMQEMLAGTFDARKAIADGHIELAGDLNLLKIVGALFSGKKISNG